MTPMLGKVLVALTSLGVTIGFWLETHSWWKTAAVAAGGVILAFCKKVWAELEPEWVKKSAAKIRDLLTIYSYKDAKYAKLLYYRHRTFDVRGIPTQGKFALDLE